MAWPGDEVARGLGSQGQLRASQADREQVIGVLKAAFVAGMLVREEFDLRVGQGLTSRTYGELADLTADLPAELSADQPLEPARARGGQPLVRPGQVITGASIVYFGAWLYVPSSAAPALAILGGFFYLCVLAIAVAVVFENRQDRRSGGQLPRGRAPGRGGLAVWRLSQLGPDWQRSPVNLISQPAHWARASQGYG